MDESDVAVTGLNVLAGAASACGPPGVAIAFLASSLGAVLSQYGGSKAAPAPTLSAADVQQIIQQGLLQQDVRDAWSKIASTHDWYTDWTVRAKRGESFSAADLQAFDAGYQSATGPNSGLREGLGKLYRSPAKLDSTPAQYGMPCLILGVGLWIQLLELGMARTAERGETVSDGEWEIFMDTAQYWIDGLQSCDRLADVQAQRAVQANPSLKPGTPAFNAAVRSAEILYHGGARADGQLPAVTAMGKLNSILLSLEAAGHSSAPP
jgi:hypothetical protein